MCSEEDTEGQSGPVTWPLFGVVPCLGSDHLSVPGSKGRLQMGGAPTTLSSLTSGRATFSQRFAEYQQVPADVQEKLLKAYEESEKDE